jgi:hypothetical protein
MYTGAVRLRSFALVLAVLLAATPALHVACEMDCGQPLTPSSALCHEANDSHDGATLNGAPHACDHDQTSGSPALLTGATGAATIATAGSAVPPALSRVLVSDASRVAVTVRGAWCLSGRRTSSQNTVLRI